MICFTAFDDDSDSDEDEQQPIIPEQLDSQLEDSQHANPSAHDRGMMTMYPIVQLRMDNIWFCRLLLLFEIETRTDSGTKRHACKFLSVFEEYAGS